MENCFFDQHPDSAEARFHKSLDLARISGDRRMEAENLVSLAQIYSKKHLWSTAETYLRTAEKIALDEGLKEILLEVLKQSIVTYRFLSNKKLLANYQKRFIDYKEELFDAGLLMEIAKTESEFLERDQQRKIQIQKRRIGYQKATLQYQRLIGVTGCGILVLLFALGYLNYQQLRRKNKIGKLLEAKVTDRTNRLQNEIEQSLKRHRLQEAELATLRTNLSMLSMKATIASTAIRRISQSEIAQDVPGAPHPYTSFTQLNGETINDEK